MKEMIPIYAALIKKGKKQLKDVPETVKAEVEKAIKKK